MLLMRQITEHKEQTLFFKWCLRHADEFFFLDSIFSIPNGANFDAIRGRMLKDEGLRAGVPDMFLPVACGKWHGLFIEMKTRKGGRVSESQKLWHERLGKQGFKIVVCAGFQVAREEVIKYYAI